MRTTGWARVAVLTLVAAGLACIQACDFSPLQVGSTRSSGNQTGDGSAYAGGQQGAGGYTDTQNITGPYTSGSSVVCQAATTALVYDNKPGTSYITVTNWTVCPLGLMLDGVTSYVLASGHAYYFPASVGGHTLAVSGCGFATSANLSANGSGFYYATVQCSGTYYFLNYN